MKDLSQNGYSHDQVKKVLHGFYGSREVRFRYDLLNKDESKITEISTVDSGEIQMQAFNTIKRTAKFHLKEFYYQVNTSMPWNQFGYQKWSDL